MTKTSDELKIMGQSVAKAINELSMIGGVSHAVIIKLLSDGHGTTCRMFDKHVERYNKEAGL